MRRGLLLGLAAASLPTTVLAEVMTCRFVEVIDIAEDGTAAAHPLTDMLAGQTVAVDLRTGVIDHFLFGNANVPQRRILDEATPESRSIWKVMAMTDDVAGIDDGREHRNVALFQIMMFRDGPEKPFLALGLSGELATGLCVAAG